MHYKLTRLILSILTAFLALTATGGGIAILLGVDEFPREWLEGTPFSDYTIPALLLIVIVGGSAILATITLYSNLRKGLFFSILAGTFMMEFIVGEVLLLKQDPPGPTFWEYFYFITGGLVWLLAAYTRKKYPAKK